MMVRKIQATSSMLCDLQIEGHNRVIQKGKYASQVTGEDDVKAQGIYHGKQCYDAALEHYAALEKEAIHGTSVDGEQ